MVVRGQQQAEEDGHSGRTYLIDMLGDSRSDIQALFLVERVACSSRPSFVGETRSWRCEQAAEGTGRLRSRLKLTHEPMRRGLVGYLTT